MEDLFPAIPEDLTSVDPEELASLREQLRVQLRAVAEGTAEFPEGMSAEQVLEAARTATESALAITAELDARAEAEATFAAEAVELAREAGAIEAVAEAEGDEGDEGGDEGDAGGEGEDGGEAESGAEAVSEVVAEAEAITADAPAEADVVLAAAARRMALPPTPRRHQAIAQQDGTAGTVLVAAGGIKGIQVNEPLDRLKLAEAAIRAQRQTRAMPGAANVVVASATYDFPEERTLRDGDVEGNARKIRAMLPDYMSEEALVASGGLCAPFTPFYDLPNFAVRDRPVRDALPSFLAARGGVTVPTPGIIGDITTGVGIITEAEDAAGGGSATKSCQDFDCPEFTDVAVSAIFHCREYGNFNARAWPESIAFQNDLTMAAHARVSDGYLLDGIKALSVNVTQAAIGAQLNAYASIVYALTRMQAGIRYRLRSRSGTAFRALIPEWVPDLLAADVAATQFDRFQAQAQMAAHLASLGINVSWYKDPVTGGTSQAFASQSAGAIADFPDDVQLALYVEGAFIHVDGGTLELGLVRDSVLNATNDFTFFGETFENVARLGPAQSALWATVDVCPSGGMPALISGLTC